MCWNQTSRLAQPTLANRPVSATLSFGEAPGRCEDAKAGVYDEDGRATGIIYKQ